MRGCSLTEICFSFAIVNWNTRDLLDACLASIEAVRGSFSIEILVADNHSNDGSAAMVLDKYPNVILVETGANLGFAGGHALLFERSKGRYHVLVNSDTRLLPGCLERLAARLEADRDIGVLCCRLVDDEGKTQPSCRRFPSLGLQFLEASGINRLFPNHPLLNAYKMGDFDHQTSREVDQVMGSLFLIRAEVIDEIGPLDTSFFMYYEEVDYCLRCRRAGYKVFFEAEAKVYHLGGGSAEKVKVLTVRRALRSLRHYFAKNHGVWTWIPLLGIVSLEGVTHILHALAYRQQPLLVAKAYILGWWDFLRFRRAGP